MSNLVVGLIEEVARVQAIIKVYEELPTGAGMIGATRMRLDVDAAKQATANGDTLGMMSAFARLKEWKDE